MTDLFGDEIAEKKNLRGGGESVYHIIGASNHCAESRAEDDYYATPESATEMLCDIETFSHDILEPCVGGGHIARVLKSRGYHVVGRDLVDRGYGEEHGVDFLQDNRLWHGDIVSNPPYNKAKEFVGHALDIMDEGRKLAMFLKLTFAEGKGRRELFDRRPPVRVWVSTSRLGCGKNGINWNPSAVAYCWWVWEEGFVGHTEMRWFN